MRETVAILKGPVLMSSAKMGDQLKCKKCGMTLVRWDIIEDQCRANN